MALTGEVFVGDRRGRAAARLVALLAVDLMAPAGADMDLGATAPALASKVSLPFLGVDLSAGATSVGAAFGLALALSWSWSSVGSIELQAGLSQATAQAPGSTDSLRLRSVPVRLSGVAQWGAFAVLGGPILRPWFVGDAGKAQGLMPGLGVALAFTPFASWSVRPAVRVGVDAYTERLDLRLGGQRVLTTPWLVPWVGVGVSVGRRG